MSEYVRMNGERVLAIETDIIRLYDGRYVRISGDRIKWAEVEAPPVIAMGQNKAEARAAIDCPSKTDPAPSANKLTQAQVITLGGGATGTATWDGSGPLTLTTTLAVPTSTTRGGIVQQKAPTLASAGLLSLVDFTNLVAALKAAGVLS